MNRARDLDPLDIKKAEQHENGHGKEHFSGIDVKTGNRIVKAEFKDRTEEAVDD